jgi:NADP-reducing hydrogenase subunit HndB
MADKIKSPADLLAMAEKAKEGIDLRSGAKEIKVTVHMGTCGIAAGAREIMTAVLQAIEESDLHEVIVTNSGCAGLCSKEPMMTLEVLGDAAPVKYVSLTPATAKAVIVTHLLHGQVMREHALAIGSERIG